MKPVSEERKPVNFCDRRIPSSQINNFVANCNYFTLNEFITFTRMLLTVNFWAIMSFHFVAVVNLRKINPLQKEVKCVRKIQKISQAC